nr:MAG TPA: hypothetical protein [Caudoviricetes sp.]
MNNQSSWSEQLQRIGLCEFSSANRKILSEIENSGVSLNSASILQASAEAVISAVAVMIEENNKALLSEAD